MAWLFVCLALIGSYLLGSFNGAVIISKYVAHNDVRDYGSGNAGMTNMVRVMGIGPGIITFVIDALKGVAVCLLVKFVVFPYIYSFAGLEIFRPEYAVYYCGLCCLLGHIYPVYFGFRGGKGVSTTSGVAAVCCPISVVIGFPVFVLMFILTRIVSLSSICAAITLSIVTFLSANSIEGAPHSALIQGLLMTVITLNIIFTHRSNIKRLIRGEEKKLSINHKKEHGTNE